MSMPSGLARREFRIAIVMYGGTSLAIYLNGVCQEFLQLVRATSPEARQGEAVSSTARIYRKLAHVLAGAPLDSLDDELLEAMPKVRFHIDVLSGTSAGGINGVMLAKALARNSDLAPVKELWVKEGAIEHLINDRESARRRYPYREPVRSLFNSDRMYVELLRALERLNHDDKDDDERAGPLVDSLDLGITATDLHGERVDIQLADGVAREENHRQAFRFRLDREAEVDEFTAIHDPLLAFAARTTSSLPAVFEPSTIEDARRLTGRDQRAHAPWWKLYRNMRDDANEEHERRPFADGGYLDNKPFGLATEGLSKAAAGGRVTRKLYYLEPRPQRFEPDTPLGDAPNAFTNTLKAFSLARYETIRSDVERLNERNRLIERVRTLGFGVLEDLRNSNSSAGSTNASVLAANTLEDDMHSQNLEALTGVYGPSFGGYHRLRVAVTTDRLATTVADAVKVAKDSDVRRALRLVASAWRSAHYSRNPASDGQRAPESEFLGDYDLDFRRRRAVFLVTKIEQSHVFDERVASELQDFRAFPGIAWLLDAHENHEREFVEREWSQLEDLFVTAKDRVLSLIAELEPRRKTDGEKLSATLQELTGQQKEAFRRELVTILEAPSYAQQKHEAEQFFERHSDVVNDVAQEVLESNRLRIAGFEQALAELTDSFDDAATVPASKQRNLAGSWSEAEYRANLRAGLGTLHTTYWRDFVHFDRVQFPLLEATGIGDELATVEIHRVSPDDCHEYTDVVGRDKLLGTRFASFGGFLDARWRRHDILWGRLDGAERLITTLLGQGQEEVRAQLIAEAHLAILHEEFPADVEEVDRLPASRQVAIGVLQVDLDATKQRIAEFLNEKRKDLELDHRQSARNLARLVRAGGQLTDTLTTESSMPGAVRNAMGFAAVTGSWLIDAGIPRTFLWLNVMHWINILLLLGVTLAVLGSPIVPSINGTFWPGVISVGVAIALRLVIGVVSGAIDRRKKIGVPWPSEFAWGLLLVLTAVVGGSLYLELVGRDSGRDLGDWPSSVVAIQFAESPEVVARILGQHQSLGNGEGQVAAIPAGPEAARLRLLTWLDFGFIFGYGVLLGATVLLALQKSMWWIGVIGVLLTFAAVGLDVWENVRILHTLSPPTITSDASWLARTADIARAKFLAAFGAVGVLLPVLARRGSRFRILVRFFVFGLIGLGAGAVVLGLLGLVLFEPWLIVRAFVMLLGVLFGLAWLSVLGFYSHDDEEEERTVGHVGPDH